MSKKIIFSNEAREKMLAGMEIVARTVTVTMGPKGRNVAFEKGYGSPQVTNDGVTIAKEIELEDKFENMGAELVKEAAEKTNTLAGDGTTTATLLTYALASEGLKHIKDGVNAIELKNGMKKAAAIVNNELEKNSKVINTKEEIAQVASLSAQDQEVGTIIADAMEQVGNNGVITVEEGQTFGLEVEITEGMEFDQGYVSPYMVDDTEKMIANMKDSPILITDQKISSIKDLLPVLESLISTGRKDLYIIAEDLDGEALTAIILNKLKGALNVIAVKAPGFGDRKKEILKDIAILTGANIITSELGMKVSEANLKDLGSAKNIISSKDKTTIIGGNGDKQAIKARVEEIKRQIERTDSSYDKEKLAERLAKLDGGVAVIKVGAASEVEAKERKLRIEDALNATRAAVAEGVVAGGGVALLKASQILDVNTIENKNEKIGFEIVKNALVYPIKQIIENGGKESSDIISEVLKSSSVNFGYDASTDTFVDMIEAGIIDPKKVERIALQEAVSLAGMFLTTEAAIVSSEKKDSCSGACSSGHMGEMGGMGGMPMM